MPRISRVSVGDVIYHVINRANGRAEIFHSDVDYKHFEKLLRDGKDMVDMRILSYCIMPNHWHMVLHPKKDGDMGEYMRWVTTTHVRQRRTKTNSVGYGHLYQGTYKSFPVETSEYLLRLLLYVEQNPLRAKLVKKAEDWKWSSLWRREKGTSQEKKLLSDLPLDIPKDYMEMVNTLPDNEKLEAMRRCVNKGSPFGKENWVKKMVERYGLESTLRNPGRPKNKKV